LITEAILQGTKIFNSQVSTLKSQLSTVKSQKSFET
jgi:hypothetical protein